MKKGCLVELVDLYVRSAITHERIDTTKVKR